MKITYKVYWHMNSYIAFPHTDNFVHLTDKDQLKRSV